MNITTVINNLNNVIWGYILIYLLLFAGCFFTFKTKGIQIRRFSTAIRTMLRSRAKESSSQVSAFQAFCTSLASRVGTGNLAGIAVALNYGGPGAIFWMWVVALLGMSTAMIENLLAQLYKTNNNDGTYRGGPAYYIEKGLGLRWLGILFSLSMILSFGIAFNGVQANSIAMALHTYGIPLYVVGIVLGLAVGIAIFGGIKSIVKAAEIIVPIMAFAYIILAISIVALNVTKLPEVFSTIIKGAFDFKSAASGVFAGLISQAILQGIKRGMFSNEAGMGSAPNAAATAHSVHPVNQGLLGMLGVFVDTMIICTSTAAIILVSGKLGTGPTGIQLTQVAIESAVGHWGKHMISLAIVLFAYTSLIANYYYGANSIRHLKNNDKIIFVYRIIAVIIVFVGSVSDLHTIWSLADISMGIMATINIVSLLLLSKTAMLVIDNYEKQLAVGKQPRFYKKDLPDIAQTVSVNVWEDEKK